MFCNSSEPDIQHLYEKLLQKMVNNNNKRLDALNNLIKIQMNNTFGINQLPLRDKDESIEALDDDAVILVADKVKF